jgi:hypothetical protein
VSVTITVQISDASVNSMCSWASPFGRSMHRLASMIEDEAKANAPVRTGALRASIHNTAGKSKNMQGIWFDVGSKDKKALWMESGTRPHVITPKNGPYLVFFWARVGHVVRMKAVNHPGTRAYRYLETALTRSFRVWERIG